jgi:hypothetical protein
VTGQGRSWRERHESGEVVAAEGGCRMIEDSQLKHKKRLVMQGRVEAGWGLVVDSPSSWELLC